MAPEKRPACDGCDPIGIDEAATILGLRATYARKLATAGQLGLAPFKRVGSTRLWWRHEVEDLKRRRVTPPA